jgi:hypothetical protein
MDFWTAIGDVSAVITVSGAAWQTGKILFKKNLHFGRFCQNISKKLSTLGLSPKAVPKKSGRLTNSESGLKKMENLLTHDSVTFFKKSPIAQRLKQFPFQKKSEIVPMGQFLSDSGIDFYITNPDNDHVLIGQCKYYI